MKKVFTLIVAAVMAASVNAQTETVLIQEGTTYTGGQVLKTTNTKLVMGSDNETFSAPKAGNLASTDPYVACVQGKANPVDEANSGYEPSRKNLPVKGCYYVFTASKAGTLSLGIQLGNGKSFYVVDAETGENSVEKSLIDRDGVAVELDSKQQIAVKMYGYVNFKAEANKSYYIFCTGSKLAIYGYQFTLAATATIGSDGVATFAAPFAVDYSSVEGLEAYSVSYDATSNKLAFNKINGVVAANTAVIVKGAAGDYTLAKAITAATITETGLNASDGSVKGAENIYCLANKSEGLGFYQVSSSVTIPANKAYLEIPASAGARTFYSMEFGGGTTGINTILANGAKANSAIYSLSGQQVSKAYKGIVIVNGKKMIQK